MIPSESSSVLCRLIGDVVFTTPLIRALRRAYPEATIAYLVEREAAPVVEHNPHLDEVIVAPRTRGARRIADDLALARRLRRDAVRSRRWICTAARAARG